MCASVWNVSSTKVVNDFELELQRLCISLQGLACVFLSFVSFVILSFKN